MPRRSTPSLRVLCLHDEASSAFEMSRDYDAFEDRLWNRHQIELVFVDAPLLDAPADNSEDHVESLPRRRWFVEEPFERRPSLQNNGQIENVRYAGLDASLLHLHQIWCRGGANAGGAAAAKGDVPLGLPFHGVLGVGQGGDVAGLLPLLNRGVRRGDSDDEDDGEVDGVSAMFQGLEFVIIVDGSDLIFQREGGNSMSPTDDARDHSEAYIGPEGIKSLHILLDDPHENAVPAGNADHETNNKASRDGNDSTYNAYDQKEQRRQSGHRLALHYGPNAEIHNLTQHDPHLNTPTQQQQQRPSKSKQSTKKHPCPPKLANILGRFLLRQKHSLHSSRSTLALTQLQTQLALVEQEASLQIMKHVAENPPRALMAMIAPGYPTFSPDTSHLTKLSSDNVDQLSLSNELDDNDFENDGKNANAQNIQDINFSTELETAERKGVIAKNNMHHANNDNAPKETMYSTDVARVMGAWQGPKYRGINEEGGGAPCPSSFLLREDKRN